MCRVVDLFDQQPPLGVERFQPRRQQARPLAVGGRQQLDGEIGVIEPAERVQARREREANRLLADLRGIDLREFDQCQQADPFSLAQNIQPALEQIAGVAALLRHVGDDAKRY